MYLWCERRRVSGSWGTSREETLGQTRNTHLLRFYHPLDLLPPMWQVPRWYCLDNNFFPPRCRVGWAGNLETSACFARESQRNIWTGPMARPGLTQVLYQRTSALCKRPYPSTFYPTDPSWVDICAFCSRKDPLFQPRDGRSDHSHHVRPLHPSAS